MQDSIFTKIVKGELPCHKVYEDDNFLAFLDINPRTIGHTVVVPKQQVDYLFDIDPKAYAELWEAARKVAVKLKSLLGCKRVCVGVCGYEVPHVHIHLLPTNNEEDVLMPPVDTVAQANLADTAALLRP